MSHVATATYTCYDNFACTERVLEDMQYMALGNIFRTVY